MNKLRASVLFIIVLLSLAFVGGVDAQAASVTANLNEPYNASSSASVKVLDNSVRVSANNYSHSQQSLRVSLMLTASPTFLSHEVASWVIDPGELIYKKVSINKGTYHVKIQKINQNPYYTPDAEGYVSMYY